MLTKDMKWISMTSMIASAMLWRFAANSQLPQVLLDCLLCFGANVVVMQAVQARNSSWIAVQALPRPREE